MRNLIFKIKSGVSSLLNGGPVWSGVVRSDLAGMIAKQHRHSQWAIGVRVALLSIIYLIVVDWTRCSNSYCSHKIEIVVRRYFCLLFITVHTPLRSSSKARMSHSHHFGVLTESLIATLAFCQKLFSCMLPFLRMAKFLLFLHIVSRPYPFPRKRDQICAEKNNWNVRNKKNAREIAVST